MISGWGNFPKREGIIRAIRSPADVQRALAGESAAIAHGAGRAYGDAALGADVTLGTRGLDRYLVLDREAMQITVEAGVMLSDLLEFLIPRGLFPAVVPGTQFVTIGGMAAANIHGKNHHLDGGFGRSVSSLHLACADGRIVSCNPQENADLFRATIGGMGLTGIILDVTIRLVAIETAFIRLDTVVAPNLDAAMHAFEESKGWTYTVAWIDGLAKGASLGRSLIYRGEHARLAELDSRHAERPFSAPKPLPLMVPFNAPDIALNRLSVGAFNALYYANGKRLEGVHVAGWFPFFFPLDAIGNWNRIYGRRGFIQHQCVVPRAKSREAVGEMLGLISHRGNPSFLAVLKLLGPDGDGMMSFPMEGFTLAIDFPAATKTFALANELDKIVLSYGGRLYLAKDARQERATLEAGYPALNAFRALRRETGAAAKFRSLQSERLGL